MDWRDLTAAIAIYLVLEGLLPFASPRGWRKSLMTLTQFRDGQLRFFGLASILAGLGLLLFTRGGN